MPNITLHRSTLDPDYWFASSGGSIITEGSYRDVRSDARKAAAPGGKVYIGAPIKRAGAGVSVALAPTKTVDTGKGIASGVAGKAPKKKKKSTRKTKLPDPDKMHGAADGFAGSDFEPVDKG